MTLIRWQVAAVLVVVASNAGCLETSSQVCGTQVCPADTTCREDLGRCFPDEALTACAGLANGDPCSFADRSGICLDGACTSAECGDGIIVAPEDCEGGELGGMTCASLGYYDEPGLSCSNRCTFDVSRCTGFCGDGEVNGDGAEVCDTDAPDDLSCVEFGFSFGAPSCRLCGPDFTPCEKIGFRRRTALADETFITGISGTGPDDIWLVGDRTIAHFDGDQWSAVPTPLFNLFDVAAFKGQDVLVLGQSSLGVFDGENWVEHPIPILVDIWRDENRAFMVGSGGQIVRYENGALIDESIAGGPSLTDVWGVGDVVVAVSSDGQAVHRDADGNWTTRSLNAGGQIAFGVYGFAADDIYAVGGSFNTGNFVSHWDGVSWTMIHQQLGSGLRLRAVWGSSPSNVLAVGDGVAVQIDRQSVAVLEDSPPTGVALWGSSISNVIVGARFDEIYESNGNAWAAAGPVSGSLGSLDVEVVDRDNVMLVGDYGHVAIWDGETWTDSQPMSDGPLAALWAADKNNWYTSDYDGVRHFDGATWTTVDTGFSADTYAGIWGADNNNIFFVGNRILMKRDGVYAAVTAADFGETFLELTAVWGRSVDDVYAVGASGFLAHYDGATWTRLETGVTARISDVWGDEDELFIIVDEKLSRYDAGVVSPVNTRSVGAFNAITDGPPDGIAYAGGDNGQMFVYDGAEWSPLATNTTSNIDVIGFGDDLVIGAAGGFGGNDTVILIRATDH